MRRPEPWPVARPFPQVWSRREVRPLLLGVQRAVRERRHPAEGMPRPDLGLFLSSSVCTRRGEVERKKRSDAGKKQVKQQPKSAQAPATTGVGPTAASNEGPPPKDYQPTQSAIPPVPAPVNFASPPGLQQSQIPQVAQDIDGRQAAVPWSQENPPLHSPQQQQGPQAQLQVQAQPSDAGQPIHSNNNGNAIEIVDATDTAAAAVGNDNQGYQGNQAVI